MSIMEFVSKSEIDRDLSNQTPEEIDERAANLQVRRLELQNEIERVIKELKEISEEKFRRNTTGK